MKKILWVLVGGLALLVVGAFLLLFVEFDSPKLGSRLLAAASEATGLDIRAEGFRLRLSRGIVLDGVEAVAEVDGGGYRLSLDQIVFEHQLLPLLSGSVVVDRLLLVRPRVEIVEGPIPEAVADADTTSPTIASPGGQPAAASEEGRFGIDLAIHQIVLEDGTVLLTAAGADAPSTSLEGLHLELRELRFAPGAAVPLATLEGQGSVSFRQAVVDETPIRDASGQLNVAGGRLELTDFAFDTDQGPFSGTVTANLADIPITYGFVLEGQPLDFASMLGSAGKGLGTGTLRLEAEGSGPDSRDLHGQGSFQLAEGTLPGHPVLTALEEAVGYTQLIGASYGATGAPLRIENNRIYLDRFRLESAQVGFDLEGWFDLEGPIQATLSLKTPRSGLAIRDVPPEVLDVLTDESGWLLIPIQIVGTLEQPRIRIDTRALKAQAGRGVARVIQRRATEELLKLLAPDDD